MYSGFTVGTRSIRSATVGKNLHSPTARWVACWRFQSDTPARLALIQRMLASLQLHHDGALAVMTLLGGDFTETGAGYDQTENLVNEAFRIGTVEASILLVEMPDKTRVSLRSREHVDVAALAGQFGGGGHARAAGLRSDLPVDQLAEMLIAAFGEAMGG